MLFGAILLASLILMPASEGDPTLQDNMDGTMTALWNFQESSNYTGQNVSILPGNVSLARESFQFLDTTVTDFSQGTLLSNVDVTSQPGSVTINSTLSAGIPSEIVIPAYEGSGIDTYISKERKDKNFGASEILVLRPDGKEQRILVQFDLTRALDIDMVMNATLQLKLQAVRGAQVRTFSAHSLDVSWVEGSGNDTVPFDGATWDTRDGLTLWTLAGGDFNATALDTIDVLVDIHAWHNWTVTQPVRDWITGTAPNYGLIIVPIPMGGDERKYFYSSEAPQPADSPRLKINGISNEGGMANGTFVSRVLDAQTPVNWGNVSWNMSQPSQTNLSISTRTGDCLGNWSGWSPSYSIPVGSQVVSPPNRCIQYQVEMTTLNWTKTPVLEQVVIDYWRHMDKGFVETEDLSPPNLIAWDVFNSSYLMPPASGVTFWYSTDSGSSWTQVLPSENLQSVSSPSIRFQVALATTYPPVSPTISELKLIYAYYGSLDHIHMSTDSWTGTTDEWTDLDAIGHDVYHHVTPFTQKWETTDPWGTVDNTGLYIPGMAGTWRVYSNNSDDSVWNYTTVNVLTGSVIRIGVDPWSPGTLTTDDILSLNATAYDSKGNSLGPIAANWTVVGGIGTVTPGPVSNALFDPTTVGTGNIMAADGLGHTNTTDDILVVAGSRVRIGIEPWSPGTLTADDSVSLIAYEYDSDDNMIGESVVSWTVDGGIGTVQPGPSPASLFEATTVGFGTVSIDDGLGHTNTTDIITVLAGALATIDMQPDPVVLEHDTYQDFTATGYDADGNVVGIAAAFWDSNAGTIISSSSHFATLLASDAPVPGGWINVTAIAQGNVVGSASVTVVVTNADPTITGTIPDQERPEDFGSWPLDLSSHASDLQDGLANLTWIITGHDASLTTVSGDGVTGNHNITFMTVRDAFGSDEITLWLQDSDGYLDNQTVIINITPVNDRPIIESISPFTIHYDTPYFYNFLDYVSDIETAKENLTLTSTDTDHISFNGLLGRFSYSEAFNGLTVYPTVTVHDEDGESMSTVLAITVSDDQVPVLVKELPDVVMFEEETIIDHFDLDDYFDDPDADSLFYVVGNVHVDIIIHENHSVDFFAPPDWSGEETVSFRAIDPQNARVEDIVLITVLPVNDPPSISGVPDLVVHYDDPSRPEYNYTFDLAPYIEDVDNETSELLVSTDDPSHIAFYSPDNTVMVIHYPANMSGQTVPVRITVSDALYNDFEDIYISVLDNWPPEVVAAIPDFTFYEDLQLIDAFRVADHFQDFEGGNLSYSSMSTNVLVSIDPVTRMVTFSSTQHWFGVEYVTFRATDDDGGVVEQTIRVTVLPVNDPPQISGIAELHLRKGQTYAFELQDYLSDVDNPLTDLTMSVFGGGLEGEIQIVGFVLTLEYSDVGSEDIRLEVRDGISSSYTLVHVVVTGPPPPSLWEAIYWPWSIIVIILLSLLFAIFSRWFFANIRIVEVFLVHRSGTLIAHGIVEEEMDVDEDVFSGMLTAIQDFIRDSFKNVKNAAIKKIDFEDRKILIENGDKVFLAVVYNGTETKRNIRPLKDVIEEIEDKYVEPLTDWSGHTDELRGIEEILRTHLGEFEISGAPT